METITVSIHIPFSLYLILHRRTMHPSPSSSRLQLHHLAYPSLAMASTSSDSSNSSTKPETSREMTLEFDSKTTYEACAPLHWDTEEWDFWAWSEDDVSLTDGEDL
jgi:hypothetical protein